MAGEAGFTFKIGGNDGGKKVMAVAFHLDHFGIDDFANHGLDLFGSEHVDSLLIAYNGFTKTLRRLAALFCFANPLSGFV